MTARTAHSVHQRLLNQSRTTGRPHGELLQHYMLERFLYRLGKSRYHDRFVLKGALMLHVWQDVPARFTRDIDLLGSLPGDADTMAQVLREVCRVEAPDDGVTFDADSVAAEGIVTDGAYEGIRVTFLGFLGKARARMRVDIGFGDPVVPGPKEASYPVLLDHPSPVLLTYSRESTVAEKLSVILRLGRDNSRMKDYYDIWLLSRSGDFDGATLSEAVRRTCAARGLGLSDQPAGLDTEFALAGGKAAQWAGFIRKTQAADAPKELGQVVEAVREFLGPVLAALAAGTSFTDIWRAPGPWATK